MSRASRATAIAVALVSLGFTVEARAQRADDITALEKNLADEHTALSTSDCTTACRALASIRRAADKICALDPDARCRAARAKADDATRRVRAACPDCALALAPTHPAPPEHPASAPPRKGGMPADEAPSAPQTASGPQAESRRGGCAGCSTSGRARGDLAAGALAIAALAFALRRRRWPSS